MRSSLSFGAVLTYTTAVAGLSIRQNLETNSTTVSGTGNNAKEYDYVIVGGGLTGLVAASRLSEDPKVSVLVIEYGPIDRSNITQIPYYGTSLNLAGMHSITSAPDPGLGGKTFAVRAGAIAGGGSQVNGMQVDLPSQGDFDAWEKLENRQWGWKGIQPYFKKAIQLTAPDKEIQAKYNYSYDLSAYGKNTPGQVSYPEFQYPDMYPFQDAFDELNVPFVKEHAAGGAVGHFWTPSAINPDTKTRFSSLYNYYDPVATRKNLKFLPMHQATEILFKKESKSLTATGVKVLDRSANKTVQFNAKKELVLAAGAIFTPHLLQLSGVGPKSVLEAAGIETKIDFPAVGSNFQDHPTAYLAWTFSNTSFPDPSSLATNATFFAEALRQYREELTGPLTKAQSSYMGMLSLSTISKDAEAILNTAQKADSGKNLPPIYASDKRLLRGFEAQRSQIIKDLRKGNVAIVEMPVNGNGRVPNSVQKPLSRGTVHLNANNPSGPPVVFYNTLSNPFDKQVIFESLKFSRKLMSTKALDKFSPVEVTPGAEYNDIQSVIDRLNSLNSLPAALSPSFSHPSSSCPMMPEKLGGVVDSELRVYGTSKLSIIDASILPIIPSAHLQATMYAVAEKASDIIKKRN